MMQCYHRFEIVIKGIMRKVPIFRFNSRPLDGETVAIESQPGNETDTLRIKVVMVNGIASRFFKYCTWQTLQRPEVAVRILPST